MGVGRRVLQVGWNGFVEVGVGMGVLELGLMVECLGCAVHMQPLAPQESLQLDHVTEIENGGEFLLDGKMADIKLSFGWKAPGIDVDASLAMYDAAGKCVDVIWWDKMTSRFCSIKHVNDDQTGASEGDNEIIEVLLTLNCRFLVSFRPASWI